MNLTGTGSIKSARRVFEILELFKSAQRPLAVREISDEYQYPASSTAALLKSIEALGYIEYDRTIRAYAPTVKLIELGEWVYHALAVRQDLLQILKDVSAETGKLAILAVGVGIYAHYVQVVPGNDKVKTPPLPGTRRLLCSSGTGWAILSQMKDEKIRSIVNRTKSNHGSMTQHISYDWLMLNLRETRRRGYALSRGMVAGDIVTAAVPLKSRLAGLPLSVGLNGTTRRMDRDMDEVVSALRKIRMTDGPPTKG